MKALRVILILISVFQLKPVIAQVELSYYDHVSPFREGFAMVEIKNYYGVINDDLEEIIPPKFDKILCKDEVDGYIGLYQLNGIFFGFKGDSTILFDTLGNIQKVIHEEFFHPDDYYASLDSNYQNIWVRNKNTLNRSWIKKGDFYICKDSSLNTIYESNFEQVWNPGNGLLCVMVKGKCGLINENFEFVIDAKFDFVWLNEYSGYLEKDDKYAFINKKGVIISDIIYNSDNCHTQYISSNKKIVAYHGDQIVILDSDGRCLTKCESHATISRKYPNGKKWVEGRFNNYLKVGKWNYYRDDKKNSQELSVIYSDSTITYIKYDNRKRTISEATYGRFQKNEPRY